MNDAPALPGTVLWTRALAVAATVALIALGLAWELVLAPTGFTRIADPDGELAVARAAARAGLPYTLSTLSTRSIEEVNRRVVAIVEQTLTQTLFNLVIFGYPGSGRGSQGKALAEKYGLEYMATGRMLEQEIAAGTPLGRRIRELYESGQLVPDEIVVPLIERKLEDSKNGKGFIFKGFPRTLVQSYILDGLLKKLVA